MSLAVLSGISIVPSNAVGACAGFDSLENKETKTAISTPHWKLLDGAGFKFEVTWAIPDKNSCVNELSTLDSLRCFHVKIYKGAGDMSTKKRYISIFVSTIRIMTNILNLATMLFRVSSTGETCGGFTSPRNRISTPRSVM